MPYWNVLRTEDAPAYEVLEDYAGHRRWNTRNMSRCSTALPSAPKSSRKRAVTSPCDDLRYH